MSCFYPISSVSAPPSSGPPLSFYIHFNSSWLNPKHIGSFLEKAKMQDHMKMAAKKVKNRTT